MAPDDDRASEHQGCHAGGHQGFRKWGTPPAKGAETSHGATVRNVPGTRSEARRSERSVTFVTLAWNQAVNVLFLFRTRQGLRRGKAPRRQYPPNTNKYKGGTLESPSRVRAGTAKGRSPQQTCVGWNRRRVEALGNAPPLRPCETPELMEKQAAYRRSQHGALRSRSPPTIRLTLYQCR